MLFSVLSIMLDPLRPLRPDHRYGSGLSVKRVYDLVTNMFEHGFVWSACSSALAMEMPPEGKERHTVSKLLSIT